MSKVSTDEGCLIKGLVIKNSRLKRKCSQPAATPRSSMSGRYSRSMDDVRRDLVFLVTFFDRSVSPPKIVVDKG